MEEAAAEERDASQKQRDYSLSFLEVQSNADWQNGQQARNLQQET
jgi:hypothetical protein